jgi:hypothetical protein
MHHVLVQQVEADAKGVGRLALGKRESAERSRISPFTLVLIACRKTPMLLSRVRLANSYVVLSGRRKSAQSAYDRG